MGRAADVKSVSAVRAFKADLLEFQSALRQTLEVLLADVHRGVEWLESDRTAYWPAQVRRASDAVSEARINLERCMLAAQSDERRSCYDEKKAFERAKQRPPLHLCETISRRFVRQIQTPKMNNSS